MSPGIWNSRDEELKAPCGSLVSYIDKGGSSGGIMDKYL